jgi:hypothetical protein
MTNAEKLEIVANNTAILTFAGAVGAWCYYQYSLVRKRSELERCLREDGIFFKERGDPGEFTYQHIIAKTGLTESEILQASFKNARITRREKPDAEGYTREILFRYND